MTLVLDKLGWRSWYSLSMRTCQGPTPTCTCPGVETKWRHVVSHPLPPSFLLHPSGYKEERASTGRASLKGVSRSAVSPGDVRGPRRRGTGSSSQRTTRIKDTRWVLLRSASRSVHIPVVPRPGLTGLMTPSDTCYWLTRLVLCCQPRWCSVICKPNPSNSRSLLILMSAKLTGRFSLQSSSLVSCLSPVSSSCRVQGVIDDGSLTARLATFTAESLTRWARPRPAPRETEFWTRVHFVGQQRGSRHHGAAVSLPDPARRLRGRVSRSGGPPGDLQPEDGLSRWP